MRQYEMKELVFQGEVLTKEWASVSLEAVFTNGETTVKAKGFYDGDGVYKVRFFPEKTGLWSWKVTGAVQAQGSEECVAEAAHGSVWDAHGIVRAREQHFAYSDGTLFRPFGTTIYALMHQEQERIEQSLESLASSPFNKVRFCVFPKHYNYNANEPQFYAFEKTEDRWDVTRPCIAFWRHFEERLTQLLKLGIQADIILFHPYDRWGFSKLSQEENLVYLDYALSRLSAFPNVWWSLANEYDLCAPAKSLEDFEQIEEFVAANDPYRHLLSNHNCFAPWDYSRENVTHVSIQTKELTRIPIWWEAYKKPVMIDECCYEGDIPEMWGCISAREMTARFWRTVVSGAYCTHGETFLDPEDVLWWAKGGVLKGESPRRIAFLKELVQELPGPIEPLILGMDQLRNIPEGREEEILKTVPEEVRHFTGSYLRMSYADRMLFSASEHGWSGHCKELAYLYYYDLRCCRRDTIELPRSHKYRIEIIDTWEMTRKVQAEGVNGRVEVRLPGREGMAVLASLFTE